MEGAQLEIARSLEEFIRNTLCEKSFVESVQETNESLELEIAIMKQEIKDVHGRLNSKSELCNKLSSKLENFYNERNKLMEDLGSELNSQQLLNELKYETEILRTRLKTQEREIQLQRNENERLRRVNNKLQRDQSSRLTTESNYR